MKLSDWASVAEILASVAVVITLILLLIGVRENTAITRASMYAGTLDQFNTFETAMLSDPELHEVFVRYINADTAGLSDSDRDRVSTMIAILFRTYDRAFIADRNRLIGDDEWQRFERAICNNFQLTRSAGLLAQVERLTSQSFWEYAVRTCSDSSLSRQ